MAKIVLGRKDWQTRTLLRAQLLEEGLEVEAFETLGAALASWEDPASRPALLVADLYASEDPHAEIEQLAPWAARLPIWIIAGQSLQAEPQLKVRGFELILARPIDVGELVEQIKRRVGA